jgi:D-tyrosyl-tRNA(Tyr) deacylase
MVCPHGILEILRATVAHEAAAAHTISRRDFAEESKRDSMRVVIQRVSRARVVVDGKVAGEIASGVLMLVGVGRGDTEATAVAMVKRVLNLRIFNDAQGKMNLSLLDTGGALLAVSQFTLYGDARGQRRPSFLQAAPPEQGKALYEEFVRVARECGVRVETGIFQAHMEVELTNDGPVTILLDSEKTF